MKNRFFATLIAFVFIAAIGTPALAAPMYQDRPTAYSTNVYPSNDYPANNGYSNNAYQNQSRLQGQPTDLNPNNNALGYFIWQEGDRWIVKTTAQGMQHQFTGNIRTNGTFYDVSRLDLENNDSVRLNRASNDISFNLNTGRNPEGISFRIDNGADATFILYLDGQAINTANVFLGSQNLRPVSNPFSLNARDQYSSNDNRFFSPNLNNINDNRFLPSSVQNIFVSDLQGQTSSLSPGNAFGYFIWQDQDRWIVETSTMGKERKFTGTIETDGSISDLKTLRTERSDGDIQSTGSKIKFAFKTGGPETGFVVSNGDNHPHEYPDKVSGFSFLVNDGSALNLNLYVDGHPIDPSSIYLGRSNRNPSSSEFKILIYNK